MPLRVLAPLAIALLLAGCGTTGAAAPAQPPPVPRVDGLQLPARVHGTQIEAAVDGRFQPRFWAGVNLGSTVPGHLPGELAATRSDYDRWLRQMGQLGVQVVRVYTILRPPSTTRSGRTTSTTRHSRSASSRVSGFPRSSSWRPGTRTTPR